MPGAEVAQKPRVASYAQPAMAEHGFAERACLGGAGGGGGEGDGGGADGAGAAGGPLGGMPLTLSAQQRTAWSALVFVSQVVWDGWPP